MTWTKICGITNLEDAQVAVAAGADALGFVFYEKSPRKVDDETVRDIVSSLPGHVEKVGVFVGEDARESRERADRIGLTAVQINVQSVAEAHYLGLAVEAGMETYLALPAAALNEVSDGKLLSLFFDGHFDALFLDSGTAQQPGGTGQVFDWQKASGVVAELSKNLSVVVAGGLTPANVADAIRVLRPWGVDVSSGVEATPGKKDPERVSAFIAAVRNAEKAT